MHKKIGTDVAHMDKKLESLKLQFSDSEDIKKSDSNFSYISYSPLI